MRRVPALLRQPPFLPFLNGTPDLSPGLSPIAESDWLAPDTEAAVWLADKHTLMRNHRGEVYGDLGAGQAASELEDLIKAAIGRTDPDWQTPLERASASVSDDLCLLTRNDIGEWCLTAASLCTPTFWRLGQMLGRPLSGLHSAVPAANPDLVARIHRMFDALAPGRILQRCNWTVQAGAARHTPTAQPLKALAADTTDTAALDVLHLRVERQTLRKLPGSGAMVFTIRICIDPLLAAISEAPAREAFANSWNAIAPELAAYKGWPSYDRLVRAALSQLDAGC